MALPAMDTLGRAAVHLYSDHGMQLREGLLMLQDLALLRPDQALQLPHLRINSPGVGFSGRNRFPWLHH